MQEEIKLKEELNAYYEERGLRGNLEMRPSPQGTAGGVPDWSSKKLEDFATRAADFNKQEELFELPVTSIPSCPRRHGVATTTSLGLLGQVMFTYIGGSACGIR